MPSTGGSTWTDQARSYSRSIKKPPHSTLLGNFWGLSVKTTHPRNPFCLRKSQTVGHPTLNVLSWEKGNEKKWKGMKEREKRKEWRQERRKGTRKKWREGEREKKREEKDINTYFCGKYVFAQFLGDAWIKLNMFLKPWDPFFLVLMLHSTITHLIGISIPGLIYYASWCRLYNYAYSWAQSGPYFWYDWQSKVPTKEQ